MFLSMHQCLLYIFVSGKRVNHGGIYGLEIPEDFYVYVPEKAIKLAENKSNIDRGKLKTLSKTKCIQISYKKSLVWPAIGCARYREVSSRE